MLKHTRIRSPQSSWRRGRWLRQHRWLWWCGWAIAALLFCSLGIPAWATRSPLLRSPTDSGEQIYQPTPTPPSIAQAQSTATGKALYDAGRFAEAAQVLEQEAEQLRQQNDRPALAATLANLALTRQQLGQLEPATDAIAESLQLLAALNSTPALQIRAQAFDVEGRLWLSRGHGDKALTAWQQAEAQYRQLGDQNGITKAQLNQAQALRSQGFSRRALDMLTALNHRLQTQPDSQEKVLALHALGDTLQLVGDLQQAETALKQSLDLAQRLPNPTDIGGIWLSLGNAAHAQIPSHSKQATIAIVAYQNAAHLATRPLTRVQAQLNHLSLLIDQKDWVHVQLLLPQIPTNLTALPPSRAGVYARINFAQALLHLGQGNDNAPTTDKASRLSVPAASPFAVIPYPQTLSQLLQETLKSAIQQARQLQDTRAESYALGTLGTVYESTHQIPEATEVTQKALALAQSSNTWDVAYRWQWQLGRLQNQAGNSNAAIAAYDAAIDNLKSLRGDLAAVNPDVQFNFRDSVEPIYRESVRLLLESNHGDPSPGNLDKARERIEALQLAELDNFFREACLEGKSVLLDNVVDKENPTTSIIYPIVLRDRATHTVSIQVIAKIPKQTLKRYSVPSMPEQEFDTITNRIQTLVPAPFDSTNRQKLLAASQQVYNWLVAPIEQDIQAIAPTKTKDDTKPPQAAKVDTLVFVLDDALRNVPMSLLWDGQQYLIEKYGIALSLGLQLFDPKPIAREPLKVLAAGLINPPPSNGEAFGALPEVKAEIDAIAQLGIPTTTLLNQAFTRDNLSNEINAAPFNVVHLATHGIFSSKSEDTFILAADGPINVSQFDTLLRSRDITRPEAIELLVLSACQTAANDSRATLGLAGFAIRAGARSTLASLRNANDESTARLIQTFYQQLNNTTQTVTKAEALRQAQLDLLNHPNYKSPKYWAPYVLIGNWL